MFFCGYFMKREGSFNLFNPLFYREHFMYARHIRYIDNVSMIQLLIQIVLNIIVLNISVG